MIDYCCVFAQGYLKMIEKVSLICVIDTFYFVFVLCLQNTLNFDCLLQGLLELCNKWIYFSVIFDIYNWFDFLYNFLINFLIKFINFTWVFFIFFILILYFVCRVIFCFVLMSRYIFFGLFSNLFEWFYHVFYIFYIQTFMSDLLIIILTGPIGPMNDI